MMKIDKGKNETTRNIMYFRKQRKESDKRRRIKKKPMEQFTIKLTAAKRGSICDSKTKWMNAVIHKPFI